MERDEQVLSLEDKDFRVGSAKAEFGRFGQLLAEWPAIWHSASTQRGRQEWSNDLA
jgi:hypothetical protein